MDVAGIEKGMKVGGVILRAPLNAKRIRVLTRRKCAMFVDGEGIGDAFSAVEGVFFCLSLTPAELADTFALTLEEWGEAVEDFAMNLDDGALEEFASLFHDEQKVITSAEVENVESEETDEPGKMEAATAEPDQTGSLSSLPLPSNLESATAKPKKSLSESC